MASSTHHSRNEISLSVLQEALPHISLGEDTLLVEDYSEILAASIKSSDSRASFWNRRFHPMKEASSWPHNKKYTSAIVRLPKSHDAFDMILYAISNLLTKDGVIIVYGMTDEGIKGAKKKCLSFFGNVETILFKKRCHILMSSIQNSYAEKNLSDFIMHSTLLYDQNEYETTFYPGMFAAQKLDQATQLLLDASRPCLKNNSSLLDYGCGSGIIGTILQREFNISYTGLDNDCIALDAVEKNVQNPTIILGEDLSACGNNLYDLIISNPPMHTEKTEHTDIITHLVQNAQNSLEKNGQLIIVVQERLNLTNLFEKSFSHHEKLITNTQFTVWRGIK